MNIDGSDLDIFSIPLYYIGFKKNTRLEKDLKNVGFKQVYHFQAIDGRKLDIKDLIKNDIISIRAYNDLVYGREQRTGISTLGTIGCTLSHLELWKLCSQSLNYIIIAENDLKIKKIKDKDVKNIIKVLQKPRGVFISTNFSKNDELLFGLHLYFLTKDASTELAKKALPIDLQTDNYVGHLANIGSINVEGCEIAGASSTLFNTSTSGICIKCWLPKDWRFYLVVLICTVTFVIMSIFLFKKLRVVKEELDSCKSSKSSIE